MTAGIRRLDDPDNNCPCEDGWYDDGSNEACAECGFRCTKCVTSEHNCTECDDP